MNQIRKLKTSYRLLTESELSTFVTIMFNTLTFYRPSFVGILVPMGVINNVPANTIGYLLFMYDQARLAVTYVAQDAETKEWRKKLQKAVTKNGNWLNDFCDGDMTLLEKTGYHLQEEPKGQGRLSKTTLTIDTTPGINKIGYSITPVNGQKIRYGIMYTLKSNEDEDPANWKFFYAGGRTGTIPKLISKEKYKCVSFAMGTHLELTYSEVVEIAVL